MCLLVPGRVVEVRDDPVGGRSATVEYPASRRTASLLFLPEVAVGDLVLVQAGYVMRRLTEAQALEAADAMERAARAVAGVPPRGGTVVSNATRATPRPTTSSRGPTEAG